MKLPPAPMTRPRRLAALALGAAAAAHAQQPPTPDTPTLRTTTFPTPYSIGVSQTFTRETNLVRAPDGTPAVGDFVSSTALLGSVDRYLGRQRVWFDGSVQRNSFRDNSVYDHTGRNLKGGLDWSTAGRVSGSLTASSSAQLAPFAQLLGAYTAERNIVSNDQLGAVARVGTVTPLTLEGSWSRQRLDYSAESYKTARLRQDAAGFNLLWRNSEILTFGAGVRLTHGRYPQGAFGDDPFNGRSVDFSVNWAPTSSLSSFNGHVGYTRLRHEDASRRDFSGVTGDVQWIWQATGKTRLATQLTRATGEDASFISYVGASPYASSNISRVTNTLALNAQYSATGKVTLEGNFRVIRRALDDGVSTAGGATSSTGGRDDTRIVALGARYAASRSLSFGCSVGRDRRTTTTTLSYAYRASYGGCSAQLLFFP